MTHHLYPELHSVATLPGSLAFCFAGAIHRSTTSIQEFLESVSTRRTVVSCRLDDKGLLDAVRHCADGSFVVVDPAHEFLDRPRTEERLSNLRPLVQSARERDVGVLFLSGKPLSCLPVVAGSSILADAETVRVRPLDQGRCEQIALSQGVGPQSAKRTAEFCSGSRALLEAYILADHFEGSGNAKVRHAQQLEYSLALQAYEELGPDLVSLLESWVYEEQLDAVDHEDFPSEPIQSALLLSGLASKTGNDQYSLLPFKNRKIWVDALSTWMSSVLDAPDSWRRVATELFNLERYLRQEMAHTLLEKHGDQWRSVGLESYADGILDLARRDGIPAVNSLDDLRGPLEWLQLSDLLDLASKLSTPRWLGIRPGEWESLARDLLPTRHRVAHMRLVRAGDLERIRRTRRLIDVRTLATR